MAEETSKRRIVISMEQGGPWLYAGDVSSEVIACLTGNEMLSELLHGSEGETIILEVRMMTDHEVNNLPEFDGF